MFLRTERRTEGWGYYLPSTDGIAAPYNYPNLNLPFRRVSGGGESPVTVKYLKDLGLGITVN